MIELKKSNIIQLFINEAEREYSLPAEGAIEAIPDLFKCTIASITNFLANTKKKGEKSTLVIRDEKRNFLLAGIVTYEDPEEEGTPGNWEYSLTFNEDDIKDATIVTECTDLGFVDMVIHTARYECRLELQTPTQCLAILRCTSSTLRMWLDQNAKENEKVEISLEDVFIASVEVEDGEKIFGITPDGEMKSMLKKNDKASE